MSRRQFMDELKIDVLRLLERSQTEVPAIVSDLGIKPD